MNIDSEDFSILKEFNFDLQPVGVKYLTDCPSSITKLDKNATLCEMLKMAFQGSSFYAENANHTCDAALYVLGQKKLSAPYLNGQYGTGLGVFGNIAAASHLYDYIPTLANNCAKYVALSPFDQMVFQPDILLFLATTTQAEILLRAMSFNTGQMWSNRYSPAIGCAWLFVYPHLTGETNFISTGLGFGMRRRKLFPEGLQLISVPAPQLTNLLQTLKEMPFVPRAYQADGLEYVRQVRINLGLD